MSEKNFVLAFSGLVGCLIGFFIGRFGGFNDWDLVWAIFYGAFLFWQLGRAFLEKYFWVMVGPIIGLLISIGTDLLAGSEVVMDQKLMYMVMGLFAGWPWGKYRRPLLMGGIVGGVIGFVWGLNDSHWFGKACLQPGVLNASLLAIQVAMLGIMLARILAEMVETKFMTKRIPPS